MTFKEWEDTVETEFTCEFGREGIRDIYTTPFGVKVHDEVFLPRSPFGKQAHQTLVDFMMHESVQETLKTRYGADFDEHRYTPEGYGLPLFRGDDSLEQAYNFIQDVIIGRKGVI